MERLRREATGGVWRSGRSAFGVPGVAAGDGHVCSCDSDADARYIAALHNAMPLLIAEIARLGAENARLRRDVLMALED